MFVQPMRVLAAVVLLASIAGGGVWAVDEPKAAPRADDVKAIDQVERHHILKIRLHNPLAPGLPLDGYFLVRLDGTVDFGPDYGGKVSIAGLTPEKAQAVIEKHLAEIVKNPKVSIATAGRASGWSDAPRRGKPPRVKPGEVLTLWTAGTFPDAPIKGPYRVGVDGDINLGARYGRVEVKGLTVEEATEKIWKHLRSALKQPQVQVFPGRWIKDGAEREQPDPKPPRAKSGQVFTIWVRRPVPRPPIIDGRVCVVSREGEIDLGPKYGKVLLKGLTTAEVKQAIYKKLEMTLKEDFLVELLNGQVKKGEPKRKKE